MSRCLAPAHWPVWWTFCAALPAPVPTVSQVRWRTQPLSQIGEARMALCFIFLGLHLQHLEAPKLGVELELQLKNTPQPQPNQIQATFLTYATACSNTGSLTH